MTDEEMRELVKLRLESSRELYNDACNLYEQGSYKSANNRAYYSMERHLKRCLQLKEKMLIHIMAYYNCLTGILFMKIIRNLIKQIINYMHP